MMRALLLTVLLGVTAANAQEAENPLQPSPAWEDLRSSIIGTETDPPIDPQVLLLDAPKRADNPALVPVRLTQPEGAPAIVSLVLVVDNNPAPVAAEFTFGEALMPLDFEVRLRVDAYGDLRAIATLADGSKVMAGRFVKASGGCAAPAGKSMEQVRALMGQMKFLSVPDEEEGQPPPDGREIGTLMIRHPNFSGLQRDQVTLLDIPAEFIQTLRLRQGESDLFTMDAGISVSEDPVFRFAYRPGKGPVTVHAQDTEGRVWQREF
ncbi:quinoprotein dehydrogenase-associated SoxYZ-like carrier [Paracoccus cavernae]